MVKNYDPELHYDKFIEFSVGNNWPIIPAHMLPPIGFVSYQNNEPACFVFFYELNGVPMGIMEWMMCDSLLGKEERSKAIHECIDAAKAYAKTKNLTIFTSCKNVRLKKRYEESGFVRTDDDITHFVLKE